MSLGVLENFSLPENISAYNPSIPFEYLGKTYIAARVEDINTTFSSKTCFFYKGVNDIWTMDENIPAYTLEDPFITRHENNFVLGGVELTFESGILKYWRTKFFIGEKFENMKELFEGPIGMKDARFLKLTNGKYAVLSRLEGNQDLSSYGYGRIGFSIAERLEDIPNRLKNTFVFNIFSNDEWGGANAIYELENGNVGIIGHKAHYDESEDKENITLQSVRHYRAYSWEIDTDSFEIFNEHLIADRNDFPPSIAKESGLKNVVFPSGVIMQDGKFILYAGLSDACIGSLEIENPFSCKVVTFPI